MIFNILDAPGETLDITDELEWALKANGRDHILVMPPGGITGSRPRYQISRTIKFPQQYGGCLVFAGASSNAHTTGLHCEIEWTGPAGGTMFEYSSTDWRFYGHPHFYGNGKCAVGLQTKKQGAYNAGRMTWEASRWEGFGEAGIKIGEKTSEASNEVNWLGDVYFKACGSGMKVVGHQALQQEFNRVGADGDVPVIFDVYASGCINAGSVYCNSTLLRLNNADRVGGHNRQNTGKNNGYFRFSNVKSDTQAGMICLVDFRDEIRADVLIDGGIQSGGDTFKGALLKMKPYGSVTLRNYRCLGGGGTIEGEGGTVTMDGCRRMSNTGTFADDVKGGVTLIQKGCLDYDGKPFPEQKGITQADVDKAIADAVSKLKVVPQ